MEWTSIQKTDIQLTHALPGRNVRVAMRSREIARVRFKNWLVGKNQEQVARQLGVRQPTISRWASEGFPISRFGQISGLMGIRPEQLIQARGGADTNSGAPSERVAAAPKSATTETADGDRLDQQALEQGVTTVTEPHASPFVGLVAEMARTVEALQDKDAAAWFRDQVYQLMTAATNGDFPRSDDENPEDTGS